VAHVHLQLAAGDPQHLPVVGLGTVATFYKYAVIDGVIPANPAAAVSRPTVAWEG